MAGFFLLILLAAAFAGGFYLWQLEQERIAMMSPEERAEHDDKWATIQHGERNSQLICPHCQEKGKIRTKSVVQKKGVSGGKATAALLTGGASLLVAGLSRKENATAAHCDNCNCDWVF